MNIQLTADVIVWDFNKSYDEPKILLIERGKEPFANMLALPGGRFQETDSCVLETAKRELSEETSIDANENEFSFIKYYDQIGRDPRGRTLGFVFSLRYNGSNVIAKDDAINYKWVEVSQVIDINLDKAMFDLAFDHKKIITDWYWNYFLIGKK